MPRDRRRVCFVTGTRAEFGLMASTLRAIRQSPHLALQIVATGMHLDPRHGGDVRRLRREGWPVEATVRWPVAKRASNVAAATGGAMAELARTFGRLKSDIVLVVGDRVEAFAAAAAGHVSGLVVAHVHGGDRALGQVDDSLRHAITKLAHIHFPATEQSAQRIVRLGEDRWRVHRVGSPGIDGIRQAATPRAKVATSFGVDRHRYALVLLHPTATDPEAERSRAKLLLAMTRAAGFPRVVVIGPNNDPGSAGIIAAWDGVNDPRVTVHADVPRADFLGLLRDAAVFVGNSSSGIIEAASFGTPVIDVGDRQRGRERSENVRAVPFRQADLRRALADVWRNGAPRRFTGRNVYGGGNAGRRIAAVLAGLTIDERLRRKLIAY